MGPVIVASQSISTMRQVLNVGFVLGVIVLGVGLGDRWGGKSLRRETPPGRRPQPRALQMTFAFEKAVAPHEIRIGLVLMGVCGTGLVLCAIFGWR